MNPLIRAIPPSWVRAFANRYVAGDSLDRAVEEAARLYRERGLAATLDLLAENIEDKQTVERNVETYLQLIDAVAQETRFGSALEQATVSLKLSSYTTSPLDQGGNGQGCREAVLRIAQHAKERSVGLTIDMESHHWTDFTLDLFKELYKAGHHHVGTVLQTRLHRTQGDLEGLPEGCRIRLVIGIYNEPERVAVLDKDIMKERLLTYSKVLLKRGHYVELGTHDEQCVRRFLDDVVPSCGATTEDFEVQMLYGVPREQLQAELRKRGVRTRLYVPFALGWPMAIAYLRRRLDEYPKMMFLVAKNLLAGG